MVHVQKIRQWDWQHISVVELILFGRNGLWRTSSRISLISIHLEASSHIFTLSPFGKFLCVLCLDFGMVERSFGLKSSKFNSKHVVGGGSSESEPKPFSACRNPM